MSKFAPGAGEFASAPAWANFKKCHGSSDDAAPLLFLVLEHTVFYSDLPRKCEILL
jgi:hypothetical protein